MIKLAVPRLPAALGLCALLSLGATLAHAQATVPTAPSFNRDVRPILSDKCFACHGPDARQRKAGLALHVRDLALEKQAFIPGDTDKSELVKRILSEDPEEQMPPPENKMPLTPQERDTLVAWIKAGAEYQPHWSLMPIREPERPTLQSLDTLVRNPVDHYVFARQEAQGISPAPPASKETLLRRATLDLTGLPPTEAETRAFLDDTTPGAFEKVIDRLFQSPAYGERMALDWLDVARYADTYGYQNDRDTNLWPWRDWVIRAFNQNLPYDQFVTWQLAGDLLPSPTQDQRLATAFNRLHRQTNEGGSIDEEFRIEYVSDRVHTFGTAFLGLTLECARCHDHKFDPVSQKNYYELSAFFNNIDESGLYSHFTNAVPSPSIFLYEGDQEARHAALRDAILTKESALTGTAATVEAAYQAWRNDPVHPVPDPAPVVYWPLDDIVEDKTPDISRPDAPAELSLAPQPVPGVKGQALKFSGDNSVQSKPAAHFERTDPFSISLWVRVEQHHSKAILCHRTMAETDAASRGYELWLDEGHPVFSIIHFWPGNAIRIRANAPLPAGAWVHLAATYDGSSRADGMRLYVNGAAADAAVVRDRLFHTLQYDDGSVPALTLAARFRDAGLKDGSLDDFMVFDRTLTAPELDALATQRTLAETLAARIADASPQAEQDLRDFYFQAVDPATAEARAQLRAARQEEQAFVATLREIMTMQEMPNRRQAYFLNRGAYTDRADPVEPGAPPSIFPFAQGLPKNRLGLAQWLLDPDHPLTARVAVNRYWNLLFGKGIVETQEDFGSQGRPPIQPELLDYLAHRFIHSGWDVQDLLRHIMLSHTYQQDGAARPELDERDPLNTLLARGPKYRLTAEILRDEALAASGLLVDRIGGPSVKPYQPPGLWKDASSIDYVADTGEGLYRRSMYTFWKRTVPPASMMTFDGVNREVCAARRETTNTPLQALVLLNDPQFVEAARVLAQRILAEESTTDADLVDRLFRRLITRAPSPREHRILLQAYLEQLDRFQDSPESARNYMGAGEMESPAGVNPVHAGAASAVAQLIMNFEEFQVRQ
ncbi:MAG: DUF1553 domain-containing protein [Candidatus Hydrogenedentes bacterium]|nr:DUF1553 domain-containing protein [Candidatus Hydrogenedentota bacterium]